MDDRSELVKLLAARAGLEHRTGDRAAASATLREAEALAAQIGAAGDSELGQKLAALRQLLNPGA